MADFNRTSGFLSGGLTPVPIKSPGRAFPLFLQRTLRGREGPSYTPAGSHEGGLDAGATWSPAAVDRRGRAHSCLAVGALGSG